MLYLQVLVDLSTLSVLPQESSENTHSSEPLNLGGHSGLGGTSSLTGTGVSTESLGGVVLPRSGSGVDGGGLDDAVRGIESRGVSDPKDLGWWSFMGGVEKVHG